MRRSAEFVDQVARSITALQRSAAGAGQWPAPHFPAGLSCCGAHAFVEGTLDHHLTLLA